MSLQDQILTAIVNLDRNNQNLEDREATEIVKALRDRFICPHFVPR